MTQYTPAAWRSQVAWHTYWRERDYATIDEAHRPEAPPTPRSDHRKVRLTWTEIRSWLKEAQEETSEPSRDASPPPDSAGVSDTSPPGTGAADADTPRPVARRRTAAARDTSTGRGLPSRDRHRLDRAAQLLRVRYAHRPGRCPPNAGDGPTRAPRAVRRRSVSCSPSSLAHELAATRRRRPSSSSAPTASSSWPTSCSPRPATARPGRPAAAPGARGRSPRGCARTRGSAPSAAVRPAPGLD